MYPTCCSLRLFSIFSCSSVLFSICCCNFWISACLLSISARRFFSSVSIFSFFRTSRNSSFWRSWMSCWSYNNREEKSFKFCCLLLRKTSPLTSLTMLDFKNKSFYITVTTTICQIFSEVIMFSNSWTKNSAWGTLFIDDKNLLSTSHFAHTEGSDTVQT